MRLTRQVADDILNSARASRPEECCGIVLAESRESDLGAVLLPSVNADRTEPRRRYRLDHRVHLRAVEAEASGEAVILAYYHSHVAGPARPSGTDARLACPETTYLIASAEGRGELRAFKWDGASFEEEAVVLSERADRPSCFQPHVRGGAGS